ncbi:MAG TPA: hypothetical protein VF721_13870 [Pyrinomonadaceae bacterium]|jgi:hypothetical protein
MTKRTSEKDKEQNAPTAAATESEISSELNEPRWSVVSFESVAVYGLPYAEARNWLEKLQKQNISGLCIVTDEAAARISGQKN